MTNLRNPQAFPRPRGTSRNDRNYEKHNAEQEGMTLRDYFAGQALMSMLSPVQDIGEHTPAIASHLAYAFADAMLEERAK